MIMGFMDDDSKGFLLSMDLLIAIIPLTIILGLVSANMGNIMFELEDTVFRGSTERVAADAMNTLLETSGNPPTWERTGNATVVGLAKYDSAKSMPIEGTISPTKLGYVLNDSSKVQNIIGDNYGFYMNIIDINTNTSMGSLGTYNSSANDIVRVDKVTLCSKLEYVSSLVNEIKYTGASRNYNAPAFETSYQYNQSYDYYILFVGNGTANATVKINANTINLNSSQIYSAYLINNMFLYTCSTVPTQFFNNTVQVNITGSNFGTSLNFYIVQVPKGTSSSYVNYNNVVPKNCMFILYLWPK
ncbi:MAG: hypothetical protein LLF83_08490 [Methanobacterium sp.]|nr:hypothetical protein [Methanobacterium sp.]